MAKLTFEDLSGSTPAMLWPEEFAKMADLVKNDPIVFVKGTLDRRRDPAELVISRIIPLENGPAELTRGVVVRLHKGVHQPTPRAPAARRPRPSRQSRPLSRDRRPGQVRRAIYKAGASLKVRYDDRLIADLEASSGRATFGFWARGRDGESRCRRHRDCRQSLRRSRAAARARSEPGWRDARMTPTTYDDGWGTIIDDYRRNA